MKRAASPKALSFYRAKLSLFVRWCEAEGVYMIQELTAHHIRRYLVHLQRRQLSSQYQHDLARAIRAYRQLLHTHAVQVSMSRRGNVYDNYARILAVPFTEPS